MLTSNLYRLLVSIFRVNEYYKNFVFFSKQLFLILYDASTILFWC